MMNRFLNIFALIMLVSITPAMAQSEAYSFDVDSKARSSVTTSEKKAQTTDNKPDNNESQPAADETAVQLETTKPETSPAPTKEEVKREDDPCAAYKSARGKLICQDRIAKIERMKSAKESRATLYKPQAAEKESEEAETVSTEANSDADAELEAEAGAQNPNNTEENTEK